GATNQSYTASKDTAGTRYYFVRVGDRISGNTICNNYVSRRSNFLGQFTTFSQPTVDTSSVFLQGDTGCLLSQNSFNKILRVNAQPKTANYDFKYQWFRKDALLGVNSNSVIFSGQTTDSLRPVLTSLLSNNFNGQKGNNYDNVLNITNNYFFVTVQNGSRSGCIVTSAISSSFIQVDTPSKPNPPLIQQLLLNNTDSLRYLTPSPYPTSNNVAWYTTATGVALPTPTPGVSPVYSGYKLKSDSTYFVANTRNFNGLVCSSLPRIAVLVKVTRPPRIPIAPTITLKNNSNNETIFTIKLPTEISQNNLDTPQLYLLVVNGVVFDSVFRYTTKFSNFVGGAATGLSYNQNILANYLNISPTSNIVKTVLNFSVRANNLAGDSSSTLALNLATRTEFFANPAQALSYRTTAYNSNNNLTTTATSNYLQLPNNLNLTNFGYTISFWMKARQNFSNDNQFIDFRTSKNSGTQIFGMGVIGNYSSNQNIYYRSGLGMPKLVVNTSSIPNYNPLEWNYYSVVFDSTSPSVKSLNFYVNGLLIRTDNAASYNFTGISGNLATANTLLGNTVFNEGSDNATNALFNDVRIINSARSARQVLVNYLTNLNNPLAEKTGIVLWFPLANRNHETVLSQPTINNGTITSSLGTNSNPLTIINNSNGGAIWQVDSSNKRVYLTHRTLNAGEKMSYLLRNTNGTIAQNWTDATRVSNNYFIDEYAPVPASFRAGTIDYCIMESSNPGVCYDSMITDSIKTAADAPTITSVVGGNRSATISFTAPAINGNDRIVAYQIITRSAKGTSYPIITNAVSPQTITGLDTGDRYEFLVQTQNGLGYSDTARSSIISLFDTSLISISMCDTIGILSLKPRINNAFHNITLTGSDNSTITIPVFNILNSYRDTFIRVSNMKSGISYTIRDITRNNNNNSLSNGTSTVQSVTPPISVNRINISGTLRLDTLCTSQATVNSLTVTATSGRFPSANSGTGSVYAYQWYINKTNNTTSGVLIPYANSPSYTPPKDSLGKNYYYVQIGDSATDFATNTNTCTGIRLRSIVLGNINSFKQPVVTNPTGGGFIYCQNADNSLTTSIAVVSSPLQQVGIDSVQISYQWYRTNIRTNITTAVGSSNFNNIKPDISVPDTSFYYVVVRNGNGTTNLCSVSSNNSANISVAQAPAISQNFKDSIRSFCSTDATTNLMVTFVGGSGSANYQWFSNTSQSSSGGTAIAAATTASYSIPTSPQSSLYYYVVVTPTNVVNCPTSNLTSFVSGLLTVSTVPSLTVISLPTNTEYCRSATILADSFRVSCTPRIQANGSSLVSFLWYDTTTPALALVGITDSFYSPSISSNIQKGYRVRANNNGCTSTLSSIATITVLDPPAFIAANSSVFTRDSAFCTADNPANLSTYLTVQKSANSAGSFSQINWYRNNTSSTSNSKFYSAPTIVNNSSSIKPGINIDSTFYYFAIATVVGKACPFSSLTSPLSGAIQVYGQPIINTQPNQTGATYCFNAINNGVAQTVTNIAVTASKPTANGNGSLNYQWYYVKTSTGYPGNTYTDTVRITGSNGTGMQTVPITNIASSNTADSFYYGVIVYNGPTYLLNCRTLSNFSRGVYIQPNVNAPSISPQNDSVRIVLNQQDTLSYITNYLSPEPGASINWYNQSSGGTLYTNITTQKLSWVANQYYVPYYATQLLSGCESQNRTRVDVHIILPPQKPVTPFVRAGNQQFTVRLSSNTPSVPTLTANGDTAGAYVIINQNSGNRDSSISNNNAVSNFLNNGRVLTGITNRVAVPIQIRAYTAAGGTSSDSVIVFANTNNIVSFRSTSLQLTTTGISQNTDYITLPANPFNTSNDFTVSLWFRNTRASLMSLSNNNSYRIFDFGSGVGNNDLSSQIMLGYDQSNIFFRCNNGSNTYNSVNFSAINNFNINTWNLYTLVKQNNTVSLYVNGQLISTGSTSAVSIPLCYLGRSGFDNNNQGTVGQFRDLRIWTVARTAQQIFDNMFTEYQGNEANLSYFNPLANTRSERLHSYNINNGATILTNISKTSSALMTITSSNNVGAQWFYDTSSTNGQRNIYLQHRSLASNENVFVSTDNGNSWNRSNTSVGSSLIDKQFPINIKNGTIKARIYPLNNVTSGDNSYTDTFVDFNIITVPDSPTITSVSSGYQLANIFFNSNIFGYTPFVTNQNNGNTNISNYIILNDQSTTSNSNLTGSPRTISGLTNNTNYRFRMFAQNSIGNSDTTNFTNPVFLLDTVVINNESVSICDTVTFISFGQIPVVGVNYSAVAIRLDAVSSDIIFTGTSSPIKISNLVNGATYRFEVRSTYGASSATTSRVGGTYTINRISVTTTPQTRNYCLASTVSSIPLASISGGYQATGVYLNRWYRNTTNSLTGATLIAANQTALTPSLTGLNAGLATPSTYYYFLTIGDTILNSNRCFNLETRSILMATYNLYNTPSIVTQPASNTVRYCRNDVVSPLTFVDNGVTASYQWYWATDSSYILNPRVYVVSGSQTNTVSPRVDTASKLWYFAIETQSLTNCSVTTNISGGVSVFQAPTLVTNLRDSNYCSNQSINQLSSSFTVSVGNLTYQWYKAASLSVNLSTDTMIAGSNNSSYTPVLGSTIRNGNTNYFYLVASLRNGLSCDSTRSNVSTVNIYVLPNITNYSNLWDSNNIYCRGLTADQIGITISPSNNQSLVYRWYHSNNPTVNDGDIGDTLIPNVVSNNYTPNTSTVTNTNYFYVQINNGPVTSCFVYSKISGLKEIITSPFIINQPSTTNQVYCSNNSSPNQLNVSFNAGGGTPTVRWYRSVNQANANDLGVYTGLNGNSLTPPLDLDTTVYYRAVVRITGLSASCASYDSITSNRSGSITSYTKPSIVAMGSNLIDARYCQNVAVTPLLGVITPTTKNATINYLWFDTVSRNSILGAGPSFTPSNTIIGTRIYKLIFYNGIPACGDSSRAINITIVNQPKLSLINAASANYCLNSSSPTITNINIADTSAAPQPTVSSLTWYSDVNTTGIAGTAFGNSFATYTAITPDNSQARSLYYYAIASYQESGCSSTPGATSAHSGQIQVFKTPTITGQILTANAYCIGSPGQTGGTALSVGATNGGYGTLGYNWYKDQNGLIGGADAFLLPLATNSFINPPIDSAIDRYFFVVVNNGGPSQCGLISSSISGLIRVVGTPRITVQPQSANYCSDGSLNALSVTAVDTNSNVNGLLSYQWYRNGILIFGATSANFTPIIGTGTGNAQVGSTQNTYSVTVKLGLGLTCDSVVSNIATLNIY
ncbi:MAG: fibronectin type III domain-containing protein, partial [Sediminibacterium sp.]|nr:fibronectin type III domain-containing protein [Sediminibacterium sp.]